MFCKMCGNEIADSAKFCPSCGAQVVADENLMLSQELPENGSKPSLGMLDDGTIVGMKWFKFLVHFALIAGGILNICTGILVVTGGLYEREGVSSEIVWSLFEGVEYVDKIYGFLIVALGVFQFMVRSHLKKFESDGPAMIIVLYVLSMVLPFVYNMILIGLVPSIAGDLASDVVANLVTGAIMLICNIKYFNKRKSLFKN